MRLEMREIKPENSDEVFFELLNETTNEWEKLPFVVGAFIRETMPSSGYTMMEWKIIQVYAYALAHYPVDEENARNLLTAMEKLFPDTIEKYTKDMEWKKNDNA